MELQCRGIHAPRSLICACFTAACLALAAPAAWSASGPQTDARVLDGTGPTDSDIIVTEAEWAAQIVNALGLSDALKPDHGANDLFSLLCPDEAELETQANARTVPAHTPLRMVVPGPAEDGLVRVIVQAPKTALYSITVHGSGAQRWSVDRQVVGHVNPTALGVAQVPAIVPLSAGPHELAATLAPNGHIGEVEVAAHRSLCIAPAAGWDAAHGLTYGTKARTLVRAFGLERRLPDDGDPISIEGVSFAPGGSWEGRTNRPAGRDDASGRGWATAVGSPAEFTYRFRLEDPGLFTITARVRGRTQQLWSVDGRYRAALRPGTAGTSFEWLHVMTLPLRAGEHAIRALLPRGAGIDLLRVARKKSRDDDYLQLLEELGLDEGAPDAYVTRASAKANLRSPTAIQLTQNFLPRLSGTIPDDGFAVLVYDLDDFYTRPMSPFLPPEL